MPDERDPFTDPGLKPPTDEFGRSDPEVLAREQRRKEREARRTGEHELPAAGRRSVGGRKPRKAKAERAPKAPRPRPSLPKLGLGRARKKAAADDAPATEVREVPAAPEPAIPAPPPPPQPPKRPTLRGRGGGAGGGGRPPRSAHYKRRRAFALGSLLVGILLVWFLVSFFQPFGDGKGTGTVSVTIPAGSDASEIADILDENGVVSNGSFFKWRLKLSGKSGDVQAGDHVLAHDMSYGAAIDSLTGKQEEAGTRITIPEGYSIAQIAEKVKEAGIEGDYAAAAKASPGFDPAAYGAPKTVPSLEGFLFPATYTLQEGTATELVQQQLAAFKDNLAKVNLAYAKKKNLNVYDVLKIASMVERETSLAEERPKVAAVIYNRLHAGQPLGIDATTRYETNNYTGALTNAVLLKDTPYNTRTNQGLPPTPIGNPGLASMQAAANPAKVPFLYYVVNPGTCGHTFVKTEAEFNAAVEKYNAARNAAGGNSPTSC
jgi:peptidoglycan lytic transglycosylase G